MNHQIKSPSMSASNFKTFSAKIVIFATFPFLLFGCVKPSTNLTSGKIQIVASFYPLYELADKIGGDKVNAVNLVPPGADPHDYEPTPQDVISMEQAKLVILNGAGLEPWADKLIPTFSGNNQIIIQASSAISNLHPADKNNAEEQNATFDPHFWLDPLLYSAEAEEVEKSLENIDPAGKQYYQQNLAEFKQKILSLDQSYQAGLKTCGTRTVITSHNAFSYLGKRYNLDVNSIAGLSPDEEPNPAKIAELADLVKKDNIKYIFTETLVSPKIAETLANEDKISTLVFDPVEGLTQDQLNSNQDYFSIMENNLKSLRIAMECN